LAFEVDVYIEMLSSTSSSFNRHC